MIPATFMEEGFQRVGVLIVFGFVMGKLSLKPNGTSLHACDTVKK